MKGWDIREHFIDIKEYSNAIETRFSDGCTMETVLEDNARFWELAQKHNAKYVLVKDKYEIDVDL